MRQVIFLAAGLTLAGCMTTGEMSAPGQAAGEGTAMICDAAAAQSHIGQNATQAIGAAILKDSGARTLRWGPPNGAWTMDYREDRVNVRYDEQMKIIEITCG